MTDLNFQLERLQKKHAAIHKDIEFLETQREVDRSFLGSVNLKLLKKQKLQLKDAITALQAKIKDSQ
jgi:uncharacterized protein YdcH (DUF465 family)